MCFLACKFIKDYVKRRERVFITIDCKVADFSNFHGFIRGLHWSSISDWPLNKNSNIYKSICARNVIIMALCVDGYLGSVLVPHFGLRVRWQPSKFVSPCRLDLVKKRFGYQFKKKLEYNIKNDHIYPLLDIPQKSKNLCQTKPVWWHSLSNLPLVGGDWCLDTCGYFQSYRVSVSLSGVKQTCVGLAAQDLVIYKGERVLYIGYWQLINLVFALKK